MGKKGKEIVEISVPEIINDLNRVYADEWLSTYLFWYSSKNTLNIQLKNLCEQIYSRELKHAEQLAKRIKILGGIIIYNPSEMLKIGNCKYPESINYKDDKEMVESLLSYKRCLIEVFNRIIKKTHGKDFITYNIINQIIIDEIEDEENLENILEVKK
ncbi:MAG: ferritin-like domain-containing protein [Thermoplasmata archaeon]